MSLGTSTRRPTKEERSWANCSLGCCGCGRAADRDCAKLSDWQLALGSWLLALGIGMHIYHIIFISLDRSAVNRQRVASRSGSKQQTSGRTPRADAGARQEAEVHTHTDRHDMDTGLLTLTAER
eukprot:scaffold16995_cov127-Isochrysis_galbana.AAC.12